MAGFSIGRKGIRNSLSFRCWLCQRRWPFEDEYEWCPCCQEPCEGDPRAPEVTDVEAKHHKQEFDFGWWLWDQRLL